MHILQKTEKFSPGCKGIAAQGITLGVFVAKASTRHTANNGENFAITVDFATHPEPDAKGNCGSEYRPGDVRGFIAVVTYSAKKTEQ